MKNRIRELREQRGMSAEQLASAIEPPTIASQITRLEKGERRLSTNWMERIAAALGCRAHDLLADDTDHGLVQAAVNANKRATMIQTYNELQAKRDGKGHVITERQPISRVQQAMIRGEVAAGVWQEAIEWPDTEWYPISIPASRYDNLPLFALMVRGHSMDMIYPEGTIIVCAPLSALRRQLISGEKVVVERHHRGLIEASVKELAINPDGTVSLWPRSTKPQFQTPQELPKGAFGIAGESQPGLAESESGDAMEVLVTSLVIASLRFEA